MTTKTMMAALDNGEVVLTLNDFTDLVDLARSAEELDEANEWLREARTRLIAEIAALEQRIRGTSAPATNNIVIYRRAPSGDLHVQYIQDMKAANDGTVIITIGEPS